LGHPPDRTEQAIGPENFHPITRYNWSSYRAMVVIELAEAVALGMQNSR
jgi:membrane-bound lytic murein transglycosylase B